jgi:ATP-dependent Clp protease ATP-binding subunit ClpX
LSARHALAEPAGEEAPLERWRLLRDMGVIRKGGCPRTALVGFTGAELYRHLQQAVVAPPEVLRGFSQNCFEHFLRGELDGDASSRPEGVLVLGPSGSGKTWLVSRAAAFCQVPHVHASAPSMVPEGIVGLSVGNLLNTLKEAAEADLEEDEEDRPKSRRPPKRHLRGMLCLDEICKLGHGSTYGAEVMNALLRVADGCRYPVELRKEHGFLSYGFDTARLLLVYAGAFEGITRIVAKRLGVASRLGFGQGRVLSEAELYLQVTKADLLAFGFSRQFLARINQVYILPPHDQASLRQILANPVASPLARQQRMLRSAGVRLEVAEDALDLLAEVAAARSGAAPMGGARLLSDLLERVLGEVKYVSTNYGPMDIHCTRELVAMALEG